MVAVGRKVKSARIKMFLERGTTNVTSGRDKYDTATKKSYALYGRKLLDGFDIKTLCFSQGQEFRVSSHEPIHESQNALKLFSVGEKTLEKISGKVAQIGLGFAPEEVIIEAMHTNSYLKVELNRFRRATHTPALNYLLRMVEIKARGKGFKRIKIRRPETLRWYQTEKIFPSRGMTKKEAQAQMRILYNKIAKAEGYTKQGMFYVKEI